MSDETYNGWSGKGNRGSAYATWRVALELFDDDYVRESFDDKPTGYALADWCEEWATEVVMGEDTGADTLATQYALAFLDDVNWDEIAESLLSDWDES